MGEAVRLDGQGSRYLLPPRYLRWRWEDCGYGHTDEGEEVVGSSKFMTTQRPFFFLPSAFFADWWSFSSSIHKLGSVGHIEDIAVLEDQQGRKLGLHILHALSYIAQKVGCYKVSSRTQ